MKAINIGALVGVLAAGSAYAQMRGDSDGDGAISLAEFQAVRAQAAAERFASLDVDGDGRLTREEMRERRGEALERMRARVEEIDLDGDGAWSFAELQAVRPQLTPDLFNRLDSDGNGLISEDERPLRRGRFGGPGPRRL
jgi:Ca2+-binding EF-hand superfamily protein